MGIMGMSKLMSLQTMSGFQIYFAWYYINCPENTLFGKLC